jgi:hypothetical protein
MQILSVQKAFSMCDKKEETNLQTCFLSSFAPTSPWKSVSNIEVVPAKRHGLLCFYWEEDSIAGGSTA